MARLRRDLLAPAREVDERYLEWRAHALVRAFFPACDPPYLPAEELYRRVCEQASRLGPLPPADRVRALEDFLDGLGLLERATRHVDSLAAHRSEAD